MDVRKPRGRVAHQAAAEAAVKGNPAPLRRLLPDTEQVPAVTLDLIEQITGTRVHPAGRTDITAARCRAALTQWASADLRQPTADDGSRAYAVTQWGEEKLTQHELETVRRYAHLGAGFFRRLGIPEATIRAGLRSSCT